MEIHSQEAKVTVNRVDTVRRNGASKPKHQVVFTCRREITDSSIALLSLKSTDRANRRVGQFGG
jgi:ribosomal protein L24